MLNTWQFIYYVHGCSHYDQKGVWRVLTRFFGLICGWGGPLGLWGPATCCHRVTHWCYSEADHITALPACGASVVLPCHSLLHCYFRPLVYTECLTCHAIMCILYGCYAPVSFHPCCLIKKRAMIWWRRALPSVYIPPTINIALWHALDLFHRVYDPNEKYPFLNLGRNPTRHAS